MVEPLWSGNLQQPHPSVCLCRASLPVVTAIVAVFVESKRPTKNETWALVLLTLGVCVTVFEGNVPGNAVGLSLAVAGAYSL